MATYFFQDLTPDQGRNLQDGDDVVVRQGTASQTTVIFADNGLPQVTIEGRTVALGISLEKLANGTRRGFIYPDNSTLHLSRSLLSL